MSATLSVRDSYWREPSIIPHGQWRFVAAKDAPTLALDGGFAAGRTYAVTYRPAAAVVAGVEMASIRDAASAFRYCTDLPVQGRSAYVYGVSQSGRFLRQFLNEGFNADERGRRVFDAVWTHVAGAAQGWFNETDARPRHLAPFSATRRPFTDDPADGTRDGLLSQERYLLKEDLEAVIAHAEKHWSAGTIATAARLPLETRPSRSRAERHTGRVESRSEWSCRGLEWFRPYVGETVRMD